MKTYVQKQLEKIRRQYRSTAKQLKKAAVTAANAGEQAYSSQLQRKAQKLEEAAEKSKIGRGGTSEQRKARAKKALKELEKNKKQISKGKKAATASSIRKAAETRKRQEAMFEAKLKSSISVEESALFFSKTKRFWQGSATPNERLQKIVLGTKSSNIQEAYNKVIGIYGSKLEIYKAAMSVDYDKLRKLGWTDDEINQLEEYDDLGSLGDSPKREYVISKLS